MSTFSIDKTYSKWCYIYVTFDVKVVTPVTLRCNTCNGFCNAFVTPFYTENQQVILNVTSVTKERLLRRIKELKKNYSRIRPLFLLKSHLGLYTRARTREGNPQNQ